MQRPFVGTAHLARVLMTHKILIQTIIPHLFPLRSLCLGGLKVIYLTSETQSTQR